MRMASHQTTEEAKRLGLAGSDTFRASHVCYVNEINCNGRALMLYHEAITAFGEAHDIKHRRELIREHAESQAYHEKGGFLSNDPMPPHPVIIGSLTHMNLNNLLIASGFELALKGIILEQGFIIQMISKSGSYRSLAHTQCSEPVEKNAVLAIDEFRFDGRLNYLPGLQDQSLKFSTIVKKEQYRAVTGLDEGTIDIIDAFRVLRNQIHFPGDTSEGALAKLQDINTIEFVIDFINNHVVVRANRIWEELSLGGRPLEAWA